MSVSAKSVAEKIFLTEQLTIPRRLRLFVRHLQETVRHDHKLSLLTSLINDFQLLAPSKRVSMGLTVRRKTAKNLAVRRKNERILAVSRKKN